MQYSNRRNHCTINSGVVTLKTKCDDFRNNNALTFESRIHVTSTLGINRD